MTGQTCCMLWFTTDSLVEISVSVASTLQWDCIEHLQSAWEQKHGTSIKKADFHGHARAIYSPSFERAFWRNQTRNAVCKQCTWGGCRPIATNLALVSCFDWGLWGIYCIPVYGSHNYCTQNSSWVSWMGFPSSGGTNDDTWMHVVFQDDNFIISVIITPPSYYRLNIPAPTVPF